MAGLFLRGLLQSSRVASSRVASKVANAFCYRGLSHGVAGFIAAVVTTVCATLTAHCGINDGHRYTGRDPGLGKYKVYWL